MSQFLMGLFHWGELMPLHVFIKLHAQRLLISVWCITCWARLTNVTLVNVLDITSVSYLKG